MSLMGHCIARFCVLDNRELARPEASPVREHSHEKDHLRAAVRQNVITGGIFFAFYEAEAPCTVMKDGFDPMSILPLRAFRHPGGTPTADAVE